MHTDEALRAPEIGTWIEELRHADAARRLQAAAHLTRVGAAAAVPALIDCLHDENVHVRKLAALGLGEIGVPVEVVVPALVHALADPEPAVRHRVTVALEEIVHAHPAAQTLIHAGPVPEVAPAAPHHAGAA
jgi:HEAT repeat protein